MLNSVKIPKNMQRVAISGHQNAWKKHQIHPRCFGFQTRTRAFNPNVCRITAAGTSMTTPNLNPIREYLKNNVFEE